MFHEKITKIAFTEKKITYILLSFIMPLYYVTKYV